LEALDRGNLFLVPLDDRRQWYRYHHLFADVLRARLMDEEPDRVPELHRRASDWCEQNGDRSEANRHALAGNELAQAADLVELAVPSSLGQGCLRDLSPRLWRAVVHWRGGMGPAVPGVGRRTGSGGGSGAAASLHPRGGGFP
jgi:hypothetical protein